MVKDAGLSLTRVTHVCDIAHPLAHKLLSLLNLLCQSKVEAAAVAEKERREAAEAEAARAQAEAAAEAAAEALAAAEEAEEMRREVTEPPLHLST